jgi:hypothetical protein
LDHQNQNKVEHLIKKQGKAFGSNQFEKKVDFSKVFQYEFFHIDYSQAFYKRFVLILLSNCLQLVVLDSLF